MIMVEFNGFGEVGLRISSKKTTKQIPSQAASPKVVHAQGNLQPRQATNTFKALQ